MSSDEEAQQDEMLAMESILEGDAFQLYSTPGDIRTGQIKVRIDLSDPFHVKVVDAEGEPEGGVPQERTGNENRYKVEFMPPLILHFALPRDYPSKAKPNFTMSSTWLNRISLSIMCQKLDQLWEENKGMGILFTWSNYLQANTLSDLGIQDYYDVRWLHQPHHLSERKNKSQKVVNTFSDDVLANTSANVTCSEISVVTENSENEPPDTSISSDVGTSEITAEKIPTPSTSTSTTKPTKLRKRKSKGKKTKISVDQRAALDAIPRLEGKEVTLADFLLSYNDELIQETFQQSSHTCDICFTMKVGHSCVRFHCGHIFCMECTSYCFKTHITEGNVDQVKCPAFNCKIRPTPEVVKKCVGDALYERYDSILFKRALENMSDVTYCPRTRCHNPVICDPNEKCASCTVCGYTFCRTCKMVYHGVEPCKFKDADMKEIFNKFTNGSETEKKALVKAYGEKQLKILVENVLSEQWIQQESKQCPHCKVPIEKFEGCNKVTCFKCNTYFCWLCLRQLEHGNPYFHFNDPSSPCYNNLFQNIELDGAQGLQWVLDGDTDSSEDDDDYLDLDESELDDYDYDEYLDHLDDYRYDDDDE